MKIRILTENTVYRRGLLGEHGLSLLIEANGKKILFDTGQSDVYIKNAKRLKEDLSDLDGIVLSHGHYDHCGGMEFFPQMEQCPPLYVRKGAFQDKRHCKAGKYEIIGIDWQQEDYPGQIIETGNRHDLGDGFTLIGNIGYETDFEPMPDGFFIMQEQPANQTMPGTAPDSHEIPGDQTVPVIVPIPDLMSDEQLLVVETEKGLSLFMGCSHMGVINCIRRVQKEFPNKRIHSILAGMHLKAVPKSRIERTIEELQKLDFDYLIPVHCTGLSAIVQMKQALGDRCLLAEAGKKFEL